MDCRRCGSDVYVHGTSTSQTDRPTERRTDGRPTIAVTRSVELFGTFKRNLKTKLFDIAYSKREHSLCHYEPLMVLDKCALTDWLTDYRVGSFCLEWNTKVSLTTLFYLQYGYGAHSAPCVGSDRQTSANESSKAAPTKSDFIINEQSAGGHSAVFSQMTCSSALQSLGGNV